jgi:hypothetical protein
MRWLAALAVLAPATAAAEEAPPPPCALLDRADGVNRAGIDLGWSSIDSTGSVDFTAMRLDLHGQWLHPGLGIGGYAILPVSYAKIDPEPGATNAEWVLGGAEIGGVMRRSLSPEIEGVGHLGVTLPTAPEGTLSAAEITGFANGYAIWARPNDLPLAAAEAIYLRGGVSPIYRSGQLFLRGDFAVDVPLHSGADQDLLTLGRMNGASGALIGGGAVLLEVVNLISFETPDDDEDDRVLTFIGVSGLFTVAGRWQIQPALLMPLDDEVNDAVDMAFILSVQALLP